MAPGCLITIRSRRRGKSVLWRSGGLVYVGVMESPLHDYASTILDRAKVGHIGVIAEGRPYVTPISFAHNADVVYMRMAPGRRLQAITEIPDVSFEVVTIGDDGQTWESVVIAGTAHRVGEEREIAAALGLLLEKYRDEHVGLAWVVPGLLPEPAEIVKLVATEVTVRSSVRGFGPGIRPGRL
ncbi:pyridoxamine 5'-phosphate oxidase [bacterium BMS3Bbin02]|nr:pyridoxamine 5'-phosphate oxidase [bacterium BMS3Bbin02]